MESCIIRSFSHTKISSFKAFFNITHFLILLFCFLSCLIVLNRLFFFVPAKKKRNAIKQGYTESDEEDIDEDESDDEPINSKSKSIAHSKDEDEDDDMFGNKFESDSQKKKGATGVQFLSKDLIDGEGAERDGDDDDDDGNGGVKLEPFNMDQELEEG